MTTRILTPFPPNSSLALHSFTGLRPPHSLRSPSFTPLAPRPIIPSSILAQCSSLLARSSVLSVPSRPPSYSKFVQQVHTEVLVLVSANRILCREKTRFIISYLLHKARNILDFDQWFFRYTIFWCPLRHHEGRARNDHLVASSLLTTTRQTAHSGY